MERFENVLVAFRLVSRPLETTRPGDVELPNTSASVRFELKPSEALPKSVNLSGDET